MNVYTRARDAVRAHSGHTFYLPSGARADAASILAELDAQGLVDAPMVKVGLAFHRIDSRPLADALPAALQRDAVFYYQEPDGPEPIISERVPGKAVRWFRPSWRSGDRAGLL